MEIEQRALSEIENVVAIDGPAGAGKSTVARLSAKELGFQYLDTGAMYRAATWWALNSNVDIDNPNEVAEHTKKMELDLIPFEEGLKVIVGGIDITKEIRTPEITRFIYKLDENPQVREHLVYLQQLFAIKYSTVAEGRDMGTVVFPKAKCKIYMDANQEVRAHRRQKELEKRGIFISIDKLLEEIAERDRRNMEREHSPLRKADDAVYLDTSNLTIEEATNYVVRLARERLIQ
ncbi:MAG TPA: (d)CMP kinase [Candidatus Hydrogenedens sp.]|nr:(d)CMP kinase [Candidatus Hydrogenedens sp.]HOL21022.1 (d)CMP kinase [Candidatus Hydrogenedens sp.]HPP58299.1 (d)CMP kinase [Candidatus Hydrogenedens sp.]